MTSYHGGKQKTAKQIAFFISKYVDILKDKNIIFDSYWEPFCGMCSVYTEIMPYLKKYDIKYYYATDAHLSLILMWNAFKDGWIPMENYEEHVYQKLKYSPPSAEKGYVGFAYSFGGIYFAGYAEKYGRKKNGRKYIDKLQNISNLLENVCFSHTSYENHYINKLPSIIYCDPPYKDTRSKYYDDDCTTMKFDHSRFWEWIRVQSLDNLVIVSETSAPPDFINIYTCSSHFTYNKTIHYTDGLWMYKHSLFYTIFLTCQNLPTF